MANIYPNVTLLVTHYNRANSLVRLLRSLEELDLRFAETVVSDDGSQTGHVSILQDLQQEYNFTLLTSPKNKGLGNNINKGQDRVTTEFTLYIQEDFIPTSDFIQVLNDSLELLQEDPLLDLIRYFSIITYPYTKPYKKNFLEMYIPPLAKSYLKIYKYSDTPHIRRTSFFSKFGRYLENISGDRMEYWMCISFIQNKGKSIIHNQYRTLFTHENSENEPSMINRSKWKIKNNFLLKLVMSLYRQIKYNFDLNFR